MKHNDLLSKASRFTVSSEMPAAETDEWLHECVCVTVSAWEKVSGRRKSSAQFW